MQRVFSFRQGDRAEYLAQYILSAIAITVPVPRQEDVGTDLHCSLLKKEGNNLRPYLPFNIQIKSHADEVLKEGVSFGGLTTSKEPQWRRHEIEQLCQTDTPFLVGIVNKDEQWIDLFCTITRYFVAYNWKRTGLPRQVNLIPYEPLGEGHLGDGLWEDLSEKPGMPRGLWRLPLGQPMVRVSIADSENPERCEQIKALLEPYLRMDQENGVFARIGLGYFNWPKIIRTSQPLTDGAVGLVTPPAASPAVQRQLVALTRIAASLLRSYQISGMKKEICEWKGVLDQLPIASEPETIQDAVQDALKFAQP